MKEQTKISEKELNKMHTNNLLDAEFRTLVIRMLKELSEDLCRMIKVHSETMDTLIEMKNNLQGNNSRVDEAKNQINDLEHKTKKQTIRTRRRKKNKKNEDSVNSLWNNFECSNI